MEIINQAIIDQLSKAYDWLTTVARKQQRWLTNDELWAAYPFKKQMERTDFDALISEMKKVTGYENPTTTI